MKGMETYFLQIHIALVIEGTMEGTGLHPSDHEITLEFV